MCAKPGAVERKQFLELVNDVLVAIGRDPLKPASPQQSIIEVRPTDRVLQILAGPGAGKTEMLVWRVLYELFVCGTPADQVMVTTFTRRAATELQLRVVERSDELMKCATKRGISVLDPQVHNLRIGTIHSLCDAMLVEFDSTYLESGTQLIEEAETSIRLARDFRFALGYTSSGVPMRLVNRLLAQPKLVSLFRASWLDSNWPSNTMQTIDFLIGLLAQHTETWLPRCAVQSLPNGLDNGHGLKGITGELVKLQGRWERYLDEHNIIDFATIQKRFLERQSLMIARLGHVFVDEFQDSNPIQFAVHTRWLLNAGTRLTVVGDDDQAIYRFRGSDINCFQGLKPHCVTNRVPYRIEVLDVNYRSTQSIVKFSQDFKGSTILKRVSMPKQITTPTKAAVGQPVRLLNGPWPDVCNIVADELLKLQIGLRRKLGDARSETAAILLFSTSEREFRSWTPPALDLHRALSAKGLRVYNPRSKTAGTADSPVSMLLGLISYLIDPITIAPAGKSGRMVMVWATCRDANYVRMAKSAPPSFPINASHAALQKKFMKAQNGGIGSPCAAHRDAVRYVDAIRDELAKASTTGRRLTLAGFVARLLSFPLFRNVGFTLNLFRQALFTNLLEATVAPTRTTMKSLEQPLDVVRSKGKYVWGDQFWNFLNTLGAYLDNNTIDDPEVESFEEDAVLLITFHQAKGLEFDHVYVAGTGRDIDLAPALRTKLFSGEAVSFALDGDTLKTGDQDTNRLAAADREREVYVAMTRAKKTLTILDDTNASINYMSLNPGIAALFPKKKSRFYPGSSTVNVLGAQ